VSGCRREIELKNPLRSGHFKPAAVYLPALRPWQQRDEVN
jgi:hypothetical protein